MFTSDFITVAFILMIISAGAFSVLRDNADNKWMLYLLKIILWTMFISSIYCLLAGLSMVGDWDNPLAGKDIQDISESMAVTPNRLKGLFIFSIWPYFLIAVSGALVFISTVTLFFAKTIGRHIEEIKSYEINIEPPHKLIQEGFNGEIDIEGGWGYSKDSAVIINNSVELEEKPSLSIDFEKYFVNLRITEELYRINSNAKFSNIRLNNLSKRTATPGDKIYDTSYIEVEADENIDGEYVRTVKYRSEYWFDETDII